MTNVIHLTTAEVLEASPMHSSAMMPTPSVPAPISPRLV